MGLLNSVMKYLWTRKNTGEDVFNASKNMPVFENNINSIIGTSIKKIHYIDFTDDFTDGNDNTRLDVNYPQNNIFAMEHKEANYTWKTKNDIFDSVQYAVEITTEEELRFVVFLSRTDSSFRYYGLSYNGDIYQSETPVDSVRWEVTRKSQWEKVLNKKVVDIKLYSKKINIGDEKEHVYMVEIVFENNEKIFLFAAKNTNGSFVLFENSNIIISNNRDINHINNN